MTAKPDDSFDSLDQTLNELTEEQLKELENNPSFDLGIDFERFEKIDDAGVDDIAGLRQEKGTHQQTKWGIKIFRGNEFLYILISLYFILISPLFISRVAYFSRKRC